MQCQITFSYNRNQACHFAHFLIMPSFMVHFITFERGQGAKVEKFMCLNNFTFYCFKINHGKDYYNDDFQPKLCQ